MRFGIYRRKAEPSAQDFSGSVRAGHVHFNLLNSLSKFPEISSNCTRAAGIARRQNIEFPMLIRAQFEFPRILVRRNFREPGRPVRGANSFEMFLLHSDANAERSIFGGWLARHIHRKR